MIQLPANYDLLSRLDRREAREQYFVLQDGKCMYCNTLLREGPPQSITNRIIDWGLFPKNFLSHPIHLQHDRETGLTEGAVHAYCNAVMWQYEGR